MQEPNPDVDPQMRLLLYSRSNSPAMTAAEVIQDMGRHSGNDLETASALLVLQQAGYNDSNPPTVGASNFQSSNYENTRHDSHTHDSGRDDQSSGASDNDPWSPFGSDSSSGSNDSNDSDHGGGSNDGDSGSD